MMSVSPHQIASDLYCSESASEVFSSNAGVLCQCILRTPSDDFPNDNESSIAHMFDSELDQMPENEHLRQLLKSNDSVTARCNAISWILKVNSYHNFRHETAYLSVNYLDRFLCTRALPEGKRWPWQLLSVACLSLAAKMEETRAPLLLDLQAVDPKFTFKPKTVQRMELLVMACLRWRLRVVTPFDFVDYFVAKFRCLNAQVDHLSCVFSRTSDLIIRTRRVIEFLDFRPSTIAAAAVLSAIGQDVIDDKILILHERVSKDMMERCCLLFQEHLVINMYQPASNNSSNSGTHVFSKDSESTVTWPCSNLQNNNMYYGDPV